MKTGDKVKFKYWDNDVEKNITGKGRITEIDKENNQILVQTTRKLHWMQPKAVKLNK